MSLAVREMASNSRKVFIASFLVLGPCILFLCWVEQDLYHLPKGILRISNPSEPYPGIWVDSEGIYEERLRVFIRKIEEHRTAIWRTKQNHNWKDIEWRTDVNIQDYDIIDPVVSGYLHNVTKLDKVSVVFLRWRRAAEKVAYWTSQNDLSNLILQDYFNWVADEQICDWTKVKGLVHDPWGYRTKCTVVKETALDSSPLYEEYLNAFDRATGLYDKTFSPILDRPPPYVTYLQIFQDVVVTNFGQILMSHLKVIPYPCEFVYKAKAENIVRGDFEMETVVKEVFTFAQHTGAAVYHANIESIPRIAPYLEFLLKYEEIMIHTGLDNGEMTKLELEFLGIKRFRLVTGFVKAKVLYVPEGVPCGSVNLHYVQLMNIKLREKIFEKFGQQDRDTVIFIRRSGRRKLKEDRFRRIDLYLKQNVNKYGLKYEIYGDNPPPPLQDSMKLFNRAVFIIGSHGAGLHNMLYSEPGTYVLEILNPVPRLVMCFQSLAYSLGHRYYGITGSGRDDIDVDFIRITELIAFYLPHAARLRN